MNADERLRRLVFGRGEGKGGGGGAQSLAEMNRCFSSPCESPGEELNAGNEESSLGGGDFCLEVFGQSPVAVLTKLEPVDTELKAA